MDSTNWNEKTMSYIIDKNNPSLKLWIWHLYENLLIENKIRNNPPIAQNQHWYKKFVEIIKHLKTN